MHLKNAQVVKLVDAMDSKSIVRKYMAVRFRPWALHRLLGDFLLVPVQFFCLLAFTSSKTIT